jgi:hypothetical protein
MDHERIAAELWVERYVRGDLPTANAEVFEAHFVGCAECLDRLEAEERFGRGVKRVVAADTMAADTVSAGTPRARAWIRVGSPVRLTRRSRQLVLSAAALLLIALLPAGLLYRQLGESRLQLAVAFEPQGSTHLLYLEATRGEELPLHQIRRGKPHTWAVLALALDSPAARYRVTLEREGVSLWSAAGLEPDSSDSLILSLPMSILAPGDHQIVVVPESVGSVEGSPSSFRFRVLLAPSQ